MRFNYQARTKEGQTQTGIVEASTKENALLLLQKYGLYVTYLEQEQVPFYARRIALFQRTGMRDVVLFARQLAIMFKSEVSLVESLRSLAEQTGNRDFREKILALAQEVEGGSSLSDALSKFPKIFNQFFVSMVKSGESAGKLSEVLDYLADHLEREYELTSRIRGALMYPAMVVTVTIVVFVLMIFFVLPNLTQILKETGTELPLTTKIIIFVSDTTRAWWWLALLGIAGGIAALVRYIRTEQGRRNFHTLILKTPLIGDLAKKIYLARFAENLSTLIIGGLPIAQALDYSGQVIGNVLYRDAILLARDGVRRGEQISAILRQSPNLFPAMFIQMVYVGERSGSLDRTLKNMVTFYQGEVQRTMESLLGLIEPALIIVLGGGVAIVVAAVLLPLYRLSGVAG
jgi:type II secretory pathway component PulF